MDKSSPTERFSDRVNNYLKFRPKYPGALYQQINQVKALSPHSKIVDVGSGTGFLSELFLKNGHAVWAVEPNKDMRLAAEKLFSTSEGFHSLDGRAEELPLPDAFADLIIAGQAFHWFDPIAFRREVLRVLKADGYVALVWNDWSSELSPFLAQYDAMLQKYGTDYNQVSRQHEDKHADIEHFFAESNAQISTLTNKQQLDYPGLEGRLLSSSYVPLSDHPNFLPMLDELKKMFKAHEELGKVTFDYVTRLYIGSFSK